MDMNKESIACYRTNYSKDWLNRSRVFFPVDGAVMAIHALCDEVERLRSELTDSRWRERHYDKSAHSWMKDYDAIVEKHDALIEVCQQAVVAAERLADLTGPVHRIKMALMKCERNPK